jgi:thiol-disulfide isomerase/thioredoxin
MKYTFLPAILLGALLAAPALAAGAAVNAANPGQELDLKAQLRPGRTNIVDFYSVYCPPCMRLSPLLEQLGQKRSDLQIVKVDINRPGITGIDWRSPLARQFALGSIPQFKIYDGDGRLVKEGDPAFQQVMTWLQAEKLGD